MRWIARSIALVLMISTVALVSPAGAAPPEYRYQVKLTVDGKVVSNETTAEGGAQSDLKVWGTPREAGCETAIFSITYQHEILGYHYETLWRANISTSFCWHWKSYHTVNDVNNFSYFDKVAALWFPDKSQDFNWPKASNRFYAHEAGYPYSGYEAWVQMDINNCLGGTGGIGCIKRMLPILQVHDCDNGQILWDAND